MERRQDAAEARRRVGIWVRVSPRSRKGRGQDDKSESPEHHLARGQLEAERRGWEVVEVYSLLDVSGKDVSRHPECKRMLADVARGHIQALMFSKLARLGRKTDVLIKFAQIFKDAGADLVSLDEMIDTTTAAGRAYYRQMASNAEWERDENVERMQKSVEIRAKLGKQISGSSPYGYHWVNGVLVPHPEEKVVRRLIYELYDEHKRKRTVCRILTERGYRTRNGVPFTPMTIERLIRDPTAKGQHRLNYTTRSVDGKATLTKPESEWQIAEVEPIVSVGLWERCNATLTANWQPQKRVAKKAVQLFAGLVYCGDCGEKMYVPSNTPKYVCQKCRRKIPKTDLEAVFKEQLRAFFLSPEELARHFDEADGELQRRTELLDRLTREQQRLHREMEKTHHLYLEDALSVDGFRKLYRPMEERADQLVAEVPRIQAEVDFMRGQNLSREEIARTGLTLFDRWDALDHDERRAVIESVVERIEVGGDAIAISLCYLPPPMEHVANGARSPPARTGPSRAECRTVGRGSRPSGVQERMNSPLEHREVRLRGLVRRGRSAAR